LVPTLSRIRTIERVPFSQMAKQGLLSQAHSTFFNQPGILFFRCHFHEYMESWSVVVPHPYYAMTQKSGEFAISDIPPESYTLMACHPLDTFEIPIHIDAHDELTIDVELSPTVTGAHQEDLSTPISIWYRLSGR